MWSSAEPAACRRTGKKPPAAPQSGIHLLPQEYRDEQKDYYLSTAAWSDVHPSQLAGPPACIKEYDLLTVTVAELEAPLKVQQNRQICY